MKEYYKVADDKKIRVIIDTDAACEADDQYAIAHALMTQKFFVKGICAELIKGPDTEQLCFEEIKRVLKYMGREDGPIYHGAYGPIEDTANPLASEAADFIIKEALTESRYPLFVFCQGAVTNVVCALLKNPGIAKRMTVISILGGAYPNGGSEFNLQNDYKGANVLLAS